MLAFNVTLAFRYKNATTVTTHFCSKMRGPRSASFWFETRHSHLDPEMRCWCPNVVYSLKRETHVQHVTAPERDLRVSLQKCKTRVQILGDPNSHKSGVSSSPAPTTDLRDYLTQKKSVHQITPKCCCERLISAVLSECHCGSYRANRQFSTGY